LHHQFDMMLEARVGERTRIARELHDTLLQSFHGLRSAAAIPDRVISVAGTTGRGKRQTGCGDRPCVEGDHRRPGRGPGLADVDHRTQRSRGCCQDPWRRARAWRERRPAANISVAVEGQARDLHPIVRDEIYKIAAEALRNVFRHAHAGRVEVDVRNEDEQFRLRVRDDGKGIDPNVLAHQRLEGHCGLRGMQNVPH
jgi:signal transduction histidine kinase